MKVLLFFCFLVLINIDQGLGTRPLSIKCSVTKPHMVISSRTRPSIIRNNLIVYDNGTYPHSASFEEDESDEEEDFPGDVNGDEIDKPGRGPRIVGGNNATPGLVPYIVSLRNSDDKHFCGGTIIGDRWILTAAHCVYNKGVHHIRVGSIYLYGSGAGKIYAVKEVIIHDKFYPISYEHDIALIITKCDMDFNDFCKPIDIPRLTPGAGTVLRASGWGLLATTGNLQPNTLQYLDTKIIRRPKCRRLMKPDPITRGMVCTYVSDTQGLCYGDSGGPLAANGKVHGIFSWGDLCANGKPDVSTRVARYRGWIRRVRRKYA